VSMLSDIRDQYKEKSEARLPLPDDKELSRKERQAGRQRLRSYLVSVAFRAHLKVSLKTTDTEIIATVTGTQ
jgi:hypothetical protein